MSTKNTADYKKALESPPDQKRYRTFEDLEVYQIAREFRKSMYQVNRRLPSLERFELGSQIRRAAVSLTNNIGLTEDQLDELLADPMAPPASTPQRFNALTL